MFKLQRYAQHTKAPLKYRFANARKHIHYDYTQSKAPSHFVMYGRLGKPLVVLSYATKRNGQKETITINEIQRTSKRRIRFALFMGGDAIREIHGEDLAKEQERHKKMKQELGISTTEFLFKEFIFAKRKQITLGQTKVQLKPPILTERLLDPYLKLIKKFFRPTEERNCFELDLSKEETRDLLFKTAKTR